MSVNSHSVTVLGGGPAGLAAALYARRGGIPVHLHEAGESVGGNCRTLSLGEYRFDTGAHRLHDRDPEVTAIIRELLGDDLLRVTAPSQILVEGRLVDFPLSPLDLITSLPPGMLARIARENIALRLNRKSAPATSFHDFAVGTYGPTLAGLLLLGYSEKLWGAPPRELSPAVAGARLRALDLRTFLLELIPGSRAKTEHLDGAFHYPRHGIGEIFEKVAGEIGAENISLRSRITSLHHEEGTITWIATAGSGPIPVDSVVATIPLPAIVAALDPLPSEGIIALARSIRYRHLRLVVLALDIPRLSPNASIYFPDSSLPFTRLFEPKNRSAALAPERSTAVVIEIPCSIDDTHWKMDDDELAELVVRGLRSSGVLGPGVGIVQRAGYRVPFAYPILETGYERKIATIVEHLSRYGNLHLAGRSALFRYSHIHDMFRQGREAIERISSLESR